MKIALLFAKEFEVILYKNHYKKEGCGNHHIEFCETGVGLVESAYKTKIYMDKIKPDIAIQVGVGGTHKESGHKIGSVLNVEKDIIENSKFTGGFIRGLDLGEPTEFSNPNKTLFSNLKKVIGLSVSLVSGDKQIADLRNRTFKNGIETMEGAAFFRVMQDYEVPYYQLRAVSNYTYQKTIEKVDIAAACKSLSEYLKIFLPKLGDK